MAIANLDPDKEKKLNDWLMAQRNPPPMATAGDVSRGTPTNAVEAIENGPPTAFDTNETPVKNDADSTKVVDSHPGLQPNDLQGYIGQQQGQLDKWSPDKEAAVIQNVSEGYRKPGFIASEGLAGLGDAIMQGVARAGPGQSLNAVMRNKENAIKNTSDQFAHLQEGNTKNMAAKMALDKMNPNSALSKSATPILEATLRSMGIPEDQIPKYLSNPEEARKAIEVLKEVIPAKDKVRIENELKMMELRLQEANMNATHAEKKVQQGIEKGKSEQDALKELGGMSWYNRALHPGIAGSLKQKAGLEKPEVPEYSDDLPSGSVYKAPDGTTRRKK